MVLNLLRKNCLGRKRLFQSIIHEVPTCGFYTSRYDIDSYRMLEEVHAMFLEMYLIFAGKLQQLYQSPYTTVYKWRLKSYFVFPLRYFLDKKRVKVERLLCMLKNTLYLSKRTLDEKPKEIPGKGNDKLVFPPEIWLKIAKYDVDGVTLMSVNRALLEVFAYLVYYQVHGIFVISSLDKMKASDQCFVRNGPDLENSGLDEYGIYVRSKESKNFTHEAIDIAFNSEDDTSYGLGPRYERFDLKGRKEYPSAIVSLDSVKSPTIVSSYSGLRCIITEIIKNPNSIMNKYIRKFSIDVMVLSDIDKFRQDFDKAIGCPVDELKCYKIKNEQTTLMVPLFSGFEEFSDLRIAMRPNIARDFADVCSRPVGERFPLSRYRCKKFFEIIYHKELYSVASVFHSLFVPLIHNNRRSFNFRNSIETYSTNFMFPLNVLYTRDTDARGIEGRVLERMARSRTDWEASTVRIKNRTFLVQEEINDFCRLLAKLSAIKEDRAMAKNYSFLLHGVLHTDSEEDFFPGQTYMPGPGRYLTTCFSSPKCIILTNTPPDENSNDQLDYETDTSPLWIWTTIQ